jgi:hypothetical protein
MSILHGGSTGISPKYAYNVLVQLGGSEFAGWPCNSTSNPRLILQLFNPVASTSVRGNQIQ